MDESNDFHLVLAFGAEERIDIVDFLDPQIEQPRAQYLEAGGGASTGSSRSMGGVSFLVLASWWRESRGF